MQFYLLAQDLWYIVGGGNTTPPIDDVKLKKRKRNIKVGKALYVLVVTIE